MIDLAFGTSRKDCRNCDWHMRLDDSELCGDIICRVWYEHNEGQRFFVADVLAMEYVTRPDAVIQFGALFTGPTQPGENSNYVKNRLRKFEHVRNSLDAAIIEDWGHVDDGALTELAAERIGGE